MAVLTIERAERLVAEAVADAERQHADLAAGSRDVTSESLAAANARVDFERARLDAAQARDKELNDPKRLAKVAAVLDPFLEDRFPKHAARVVELHDQARAAMAELVEVLGAMSTDAKSTARALHPLRPLHESTEEQVTELDYISQLTSSLAKDAEEAETRLRALQSAVGINQPQYMRIERLRRVLDGGQLRPKPRPKIEVITRNPDGKWRTAPREVEVQVAHRMVAGGKARYANPADDPRPKPAPVDEEMEPSHG